LFNRTVTNNEADVTYPTKKVKVLTMRLEKQNEKKTNSFFYEYLLYTKHWFMVSTPR